MPHASPSKQYAMYSAVALSMAIGWSRNSHKLPISRGVASSALWSVPWVLSSVGSWWLLKAIGNVKVGVTQKLGTLVEGPNASYKRRLGFLERWYVAHSRTGMHTGFLIALELERTTAGQPPLTVDGIRQVLQRVGEKLPWLRVKVKRDGVNGCDSRESLHKVVASSQKSSSAPQTSIWGDDLYLEVTGTDDNRTSKPGNIFGLRQVTVPIGADFDEYFRRLLEEESVQEWHDEDPNSPLWRVTVVTSDQQESKFSLILAFHHLLVDGMGATAVAHTILDEINNKSPSTTGSDATNLAPPMEDIMDTVPTLGHLLIPVLLDRFPSLLPYLKPPHWQGLVKHDVSGSMPRQSSMVCCSISLDKDLLSKTCKDLNVTVNSLFVATLCKAIAKIIGDQKEHISGAMTTRDKDSTTVRFKVQIAKSERDNCHLNPSDLSVYLSGPQVYVACCSSNTSKRPLDEYRSIGSSFQKNLRASFRGAVMDMGLCSFITGDWIQFATKYAKNKPNGISDSIEFSNIGKVTRNIGDAPSSTQWNVKNFWFAQGRRETGAAMIATVARNGVAGEEIRAVLSSFPQAVPRNTLELIAATWKTDLEQLAGQKST